MSSALNIQSYINAERYTFQVALTIRRLNRQIIVTRSILNDNHCVHRVSTHFPTREVSSLTLCS